jgi:hypothetical protein
MREYKVMVLNISHNICHLAEFMNSMDYYRDKAQRTYQTWIASDTK